MEIRTKETIPLWAAVSITVLVSLPFGWFLGVYNLPVFVSFIVWAEYFALGARPRALRVIVPSFTMSAALTGVAMAVAAVLEPSISSNAAFAVCLSVGAGVMTWAMRFSATLRAGSLAYFNGISMLLAVYLTESFPTTAFTTDPVLLPLVAGAWTILGGLLGAGLGWFNVTITFPRPRS